MLYLIKMVEVWNIITKDYAIIKVHKLDGNRDVYIGVTNMKLSDLEL